MTDIVDGPEVDTLLNELTCMIGREDPYPRYHRLREISPIVRADDDALVLTRHADIAAVTRDPHLGHFPPHMLDMFSPGWQDHPAMWTINSSILAINPPDHTRLRRLVSSSFTPRRVQALRPRIEQMVDDLLDAMPASTDFVQAFAFPLPVDVIGELLGIPSADRPQFQTLVRDWTQVLEIIDADVLAVADPAAQQIRDYLTALAAERRANPRDDLLSALVTAEADGDKLSEDELITMATLLFGAGFETTTNLLSNSVAALLANPTQLDLLRSGTIDPATAVEELLRFDTPVQLVARVAWEDVTVAGVELEAGTRIVSYLGAGNRDPQRFPHPDTLDLTRPDNAPLSFGGGIHYCLGAPLARLEAQIALPALVRRFPHLAPSAPAERRNSLTIRGFTSLPLTTT